jgi:nucleotide-binding universal stress UspA family protein
VPKLRDRHEDLTRLPAEPTRARPVVLATLSVRVDPSAERMAIDSALEAGVPLIIANLLPFRPYPTTFGLLGPEGMTLPHEEDLDAVRSTAARAGKLGVKTELLRVTTRHPVRALLEVVRERDAGLLVFGPDLSRTGRWRFRAFARRVRKQADCLVWVAPDG